ncbi:cysteine proteinase [Phlegmacium glaucopus]|nr:cysteine proteinase [Phlegmacium glaucopus]
MARSKWISFGAQQQLDRAAAKSINASTASSFPSSADAKKFGLENFGNTCYANSVLQALYFCTPFRDLLLQEVGPVHPQQDHPSSPVAPPTPNKSPPPLTPLRRKPERKPSISGPSSEVASGNSSQVVYPIPASPPTLFSALRSLFLHISSNPGEKGTVAPRAFIDKLKELNENFRSTMHQDAHEFLNFLLNRIVEEIEEDKKQAQNGVGGEDLSGSVATLASKTTPTVTTASSNSGTRRQDATLVHKLFEGVLTSETRCLTCETVSSRDESFLDLSIDIEQNSSLTACLRQFSASEMLCQKNKFFCDSCCDLQEAEKRMKIKKLPNVLALHLKRFKYQEDVAKYIKLAYRVAFPYELRLFNTVDDMDDADRLYNLFAIVVHVGNGPHHGHYISIIKTAGTWLVFDDDNVYPIPENDIPKYFGDSTSGSAYVLYYQAVDIDLVSLGLRPLEPSPEIITNLIPSPHRSPALQYQTLAPVPALPPGLNPHSLASSEIDADHNHLPPTTPSPVPLYYSEPEEAVTIPMSISTPQSHDLPTASSVVASSPVTSGFGTFISTIRRAPSMSGARGNIGALPGYVPNGGGERRSTTEKTPRPSTSTPSFAVSGERSQELPPPLPPLPPGIVNRSNSPSNVAPPNVNPVFNTQVTDSKKDKEKDKTKSAGGWFGKKKKSLRITEKSLPDSGVPSPSLSPAIKGDEHHGSHTHWFGNHASPLSSSPNGAAIPTDFTGLRPDGSKSEKYQRDHRLNGYHRVPPPEPVSLFHVSHSHLTDTPSATSRPTLSQSRSSTLLEGSDTGSSTPVDFPSRKPSLVPSSADRFRSLIDRKKSVELKPPSPSSSSRPMTAPSSPSHMTEFNRTPPPLPPKVNSHRSNVSLSDGQTSPSYMTTAYNRMPPPLTPPHIVNSHRPNMSLSNGQTLLSTEPQNIAKGKSKSADVDGSSASDKPTYMRGLPVSESPTSLAASVGQNNSVGSTNSTTLSIRRATRKLSLGFGKRDKEKDRERDRVSPSGFTRF